MAAPAVLGVKELITIGSSLITAATLVKKGKETAEKATAPKSAGDKKYQLEITIVNKTQFTLNLGDDGTFFDSGRYSDNHGVQDVEPFSKFNYCVCNDDAVFIDSGVTGGNSFTIFLDTGVRFNFGIGWTCPVIGSYKASVVEEVEGDGDKPAKKAYENATNNGSSITSSKAWKDKDGKIIKFRLSAVPGAKPIFTVTQLLHESDNWVQA